MLVWQQNIARSASQMEVLLGAAYDHGVERILIQVPAYITKGCSTWDGWAIIEPSVDIHIMHAQVWVRQGLQE